MEQKEFNVILKSLAEVINGKDDLIQLLNYKINMLEDKVRKLESDSKNVKG